MGAAGKLCCCDHALVTTLHQRRDYELSTQKGVHFVAGNFVPLQAAHGLLQS